MNHVSEAASLLSAIEGLLGGQLPAVDERRLIRLRVGVGQHELADALGVSRFTLWRWETGKIEPSGPARRAYAGALRALRGATDA